MKPTAHKKRGRGRPALPPEEVKEVFPLRVSKNEKEQFQRAATVHGKTIREWMMESLIRLSTGVDPVTGEKVEIPKENRKLAKAS